MKTEAEFVNHTFVLRIWRETAVADWRFSLQSTQPEEKRHFASQKALFNYIERFLAEEETHQASPQGDKPCD
jgi:hypothetical protein